MHKLAGMSEALKCVVIAIPNVYTQAAAAAAAMEVIKAIATDASRQNGYNACVTQPEQTIVGRSEGLRLHHITSPLRAYTIIIVKFLHPRFTCVCSYSVNRLIN